MKSSLPITIAELVSQINDYSLDTINEDISHTISYMDCLLGEHEKGSEDYNDIKSDLDDVEEVVDDFKRDLLRFVSSLKTFRESVSEK